MSIRKLSLGNIISFSPLQCAICKSVLQGVGGSVDYGWIVH